MPNYPFKIVETEQVAPGILYLVPRVEILEVTTPDGETKTFWLFKRQQAAVLRSIQCDSSQGEQEAK